MHLPLLYGRVVLRLLRFIVQYELEKFCIYFQNLGKKKSLRYHHAAFMAQLSMDIIKSRSLIYEMFRTQVVPDGRSDYGRHSEKLFATCVLMISDTT